MRQYFETKKPEEEAHETDSLPFVKMLARSFVWKELLSSGTYADKTDLADVLGISRQKHLVSRHARFDQIVNL